MELALHDPEHGYYARGAERLGPRGDFVTASDAGRGFGAALARQLAEIDRRIGPLDPFHVVEFGAGRGLLARDVLDALAADRPELGVRTRYVIVEPSTGMGEAARANAPEAEILGEAPEAGTYQGCAIAVELFDALPVHRLRRREGRLVEVFVGLGSSGELVECDGEPVSEAAALAARWNVAPEDGMEAEVAPGARAALDAMAGALSRGVLIVVDYGDSAERLYGSGRPRGTLLAYRGHRTSEDYLAHVGEQDLTAHVNFSALEEHARELGLEVLGRTTQDRFLVANGLLEAFEGATEAEWRDAARIKRRLQALQLIHPSGMGRAFQVLVLAKGCAQGLDLAGLRDPFARR